MKKRKKKVETNPLLMARREWDFQVQRSYRSKQMWMIVAILSLCCLGACLLFTFSHIRKPALIPYVVTVDKEGQVNFEGVVNRRHTLTATDAVVRNYLIRAITNMRTISTDNIILKKSLADVYTIFTPDAQRQMTELIMDDKPFELAQTEKRRDIRITLFEKVSEKTWRTEWIEEIREKGMLVDTYRKTATFTYTQQHPDNEKQAEVNPFGLYFTSFYISERRL